MEKNTFGIYHNMLLLNLCMFHKTGFVTGYFVDFKWMSLLYYTYIFKRMS